MLRAFRWFHTLDVITVKKVGKLVKKNTFFVVIGKEQKKKIRLQNGIIVLVL